MPRKFVALIVAVVVAAGISIPLVLTGSSRPSPEQVCQSFVTQTLSWQNVKGVETATDHAQAVEFQVSERYVTLTVLASSPVFLGSKKVQNQDLGIIGGFYDHYGRQLGEVNAIFDFENFISELQVYGSLLFENANGTLTTSVFSKVGSYANHTLYVGGRLNAQGTELIGYTFRVSR